MKNKRKGLLAVLLVMVIAVASISAYFTDTETVTNTFTIGEVDIELTEPNWDALPDANDNEIPDVAENIVPSQIIIKDPKVTNVGINDAFIFVEVEVPYASIITVQDNGTRNAKTETELFTYTVNNGWVELGTGTKDTTKKVVKHTYAYGNSEKLTVVVKDVSTSSLFDSVTFVNAIEGQGLENSTKAINITAKAIQTTNLNGGISDPAGVLAIINNQL